jgi:hypothetical protein
VENARPGRSASLKETKDERPLEHRQRLTKLVAKP